MHDIERCEGGLQLADIVTKNVGDTDFNPRTKHMMVRLYTGRTLIQERWEEILLNKVFYMTRIY